jgi:hypothetical protein
MHSYATRRFKVQSPMIVPVIEVGRLITANYLLITSIIGDIFIDPVEKNGGSTCFATGILEQVQGALTGVQLGVQSADEQNAGYQAIRPNRR